MAKKHSDPAADTPVIHAARSDNDVLRDLGITATDVLAKKPVPGGWKIITTDGRKLYWPPEIAPVYKPTAVPAREKP